MKEQILSQLECFKDPLFKFDPFKHKYTYDGVVLQSVTNLVGTFHKPFDTEGKSLKKAEELGISQDEVKKQWQATNDRANDIGTLTHQWIEDYFNQKWSPLPTDPDLIHRINKFNKVFSKHLHKLEPVQFEVRVFSKDWKLAGTIDALFIRDGKLYIVDWKTNRKFTDDIHKDGRWQKLLEPFGEFYKNHHNEYSIQLCLYALILKQWGIDVSGAYLVYIGPDEEDAKLIPCKNMMPYIQQYFDNKKDSL
jgi:ATP-dependent exoDNAse (exonuclease V) beta subunit